MFGQKKSFFKGKLFFLVLAILFVSGYILDKDDFSGIKKLYTGKDNQNQIEVREDENNTQITLQNQNNQIRKINPDTKLLLRIYDNATNDVKTEELILPEGVVNLPLDAAKDYISQQYKDCTVGEVNEKYILIYKTITDSIDKTNTAQTEKTTPYYLLKADKEKINIYYYDENGHEKFLKETGIVFKLLSESDQRLFENGIKKETIEQVNELLENFDS